MNAEGQAAAAYASGYATASMGPRSDERGRLEDYIEDWSKKELQWGRVRMNAEGLEKGGTKDNASRLQWGRVRMNAEGSPRARGIATGPPSFNGAAFG